MYMRNAVTIEDFYRLKTKRRPHALENDIGHFNVFHLEDFVGHEPKPIPYSRKDFYKIGLTRGDVKLYYADRSMEATQQSLFFANPRVPYDWEIPGDQASGYFCVFTGAFFNRFGDIDGYPVFQPGCDPLFLLSDEQLSAAQDIFQRMLAEIHSDYRYKYDVLRNLVFELIHNAQKMQPAKTIAQTVESNASARITSLFLDLLERQFPIESPRGSMELRSPSAFAARLAIHVNHLNRALKEATGKTTSRIIAERIIQEAKILLRHSDDSVKEIARALRFEEASHFVHFFKKETSMTPGAFRNGGDI